MGPVDAAVGAAVPIAACAGAPLAGVAAAVADAGPPVVRNPIEPQPASTAAAPSASSPDDSRSADRIDAPFAAFDLVVSRGLQRLQRLEALAHPLVVEALGRAMGVDAVQLDRLLHVRIGLLLEH